MLALLCLSSDLLFVGVRGLGISLNPYRRLTSQHHRQHQQQQQHAWNRAAEMEEALNQYRAKMRLQPVMSRYGRVRYTIDIFTTTKLSQDTYRN